MATLDVPRFMKFALELVQGRSPKKKDVELANIILALYERGAVDAAFMVFFLEHIPDCIYCSRSSRSDLKLLDKMELGVWKAKKARVRRVFNEMQ